MISKETIFEKLKSDNNLTPEDQFFLDNWPEIEKQVNDYSIIRFITEQGFSEQSLTSIRTLAFMIFLNQKHIKVSKKAIKFQEWVYRLLSFPVTPDPSFEDAKSYFWDVWNLILDCLAKGRFDENDAGFESVYDKQGPLIAKLIEMGYGKGEFW